MDYLKIAEVRSRFESSSNDNDDDDEEENDNNHSNSNGFKEFLNCMKLLGVTCKFVDRWNKMFFVMDFRKNVHVKPSLDVTYTAKPCIYKRR